MANVHGFRELNNRPNNNNNRPANANPNAIPDEIPFMNPLKEADRPPLEQTIPYTIKLICFPDFKVVSVSFLYLLLIWGMYIACCTQGLDKSQNQVLAVLPSQLIRFGGASGSLVRDGQVYRLITASLLHSNLLHIVVNSIFLLFLVTRFEKLYPYQTPLVLLTSSITGFMLSVLCNRSTITVGASTAIFGVLGGFIAYLVINWTALERYGPIRSTLCCTIGILVFFSLLFSISSAVDAIAHIGGLIGGLFTSLAILPAMQEKSKIVTAVGAGALLATNLITFLIFYLTD